jgi:hypothetical protein
MKKMLIMLVVLLMVSLIAGTCYGIVIKGRPDYCFSWVDNGGKGVMNEKVVYYYTEASCFTPTSESNIVVFAYKQTYTEYGKGVFKNILPSNIGYAIFDMAVNLSTNKYNEYAFATYDINGNLIEKKLNLENGDIDPNGWRNIKQDSPVDRIVNRLKARPYCVPCK